MGIMKDGALGREYGYSDEASAAAAGEVAEVIALLDRQLHKQDERGSKYLIGDAVTAADVYWATMSMCVTDTPPEIMPATNKTRECLNFSPPIRKCQQSRRFLPTE